MPCSSRPWMTSPIFSATASGGRAIWAPICYYSNYISFIDIHYLYLSFRRKFRSQTSDNMDRWKSRGGKSQRREEKKREDQRRERVRRKKMQVREKVEKSRFTAFFTRFVAPEGRKVGSLERRARSHLARWEIKSCTLLWREAHFKVKMYKTYQVRSTFGSWDVEKVHAIVARDTFPSQNVQGTSVSDRFWKLTCRKSARRCGAKHISNSKCTKHIIFGRTTFGSWDVEKVHAVVVWSTFPSQKWKKSDNWRVRSTFGRSDVVSRGGRRGLCTLSKVCKT